MSEAKREKRAESRQPHARALAQSAKSARATRIAARRSSALQEPLSERLVELARPYEDGAESPQAYETLLGVAGIAWNLASRPKREQEAWTTRFALDVEEGHPEVLRDLVTALIRRKRRLFPTDHRIILGCHISSVGDQYHVTVASADLDVAQPATAARGRRTATGGSARGLRRGARG